ncbi:predicted protein [Histoplasma capsulatum var. duboisii H88]|uniref:Predicted protein n=1 Tax=Ajellomyces capsulatus (strain H88) TaxID=544711 RepID=F0U5X6_AJEC8|nr:predicted protein [Histoplasma capsulatum var. duboisii H88]
MGCQNRAWAVGGDTVTFMIVGINRARGTRSRQLTRPRQRTRINSGGDNGRLTMSLLLQPTYSLRMRCTVPLILPSPRNTLLLWDHQAAAARWAVPRQTAPSLAGPLAGAASLPTRTARFVQDDRLRRWLPQLPAADQTVLWRKVIHLTWLLVGRP